MATATTANTFNPLDYSPSDLDVNAMMRSRVRSILKSYNSRADAIAEATQNAVDELRMLHRATGTVGQVTVSIDVPRGTMEVRDNGRGIDLANAKKWLGPDRSSKQEAFSKRLVSGHKGVGMTFLAYGFNYFTLESKTETEHYRITLFDGRKWAEGDEPDATPPMALIEHNPTGARLLAPGTSVKLQVDATTEPKDLAKFLNTAEFAATVLETQTAIGTVDLDQVPFTARLEYTPSQGPMVSLPLRPSYRYPHMGLPDSVRTYDFADLRARHSPGSEISAELKGSAHAVYHHYTPAEICDVVGSVVRADNLDTVEEFHEFVRLHQVSIYVMHAHSASLTKTMAAAWSVPGNKKLHAASIHIATDHQISQWSKSVVPARSAHNASRLWLVIHAHNIEPDLGRKDFGPQVKDLVSVAEDAVVEDMLKKATPYLLVAEPKPVDEVSPDVRAALRRQRPFPFQISGVPTLPMVSEPAEEQDVVGLVNQLMGNGLLGHLRPLLWSATSYDSHFDIDPEATHPLVQATAPGATALAGRTLSVAAECKFSGAELLPDLVNKTKRWTDLGILVCWEVGPTSRTLGGKTLTFRPATDPTDRRYAGVTHVARLSSNTDHVVSVIALKDLLTSLNG